MVALEVLALKAGIGAVEAADLDGFHVAIRCADQIVAQPQLDLLSSFCGVS